MLKKVNFKLSDRDNLEMFRYIVEKDCKNLKAKGLMKMELVDSLTWTFQASEKSAKFVKKHVLSMMDDHEHFFSTLAENEQFTVEKLGIIIFWIITQWTQEKSSENELVARAAYSHGFFFASTSEAYHSILQKSGLPVVSYAGGVLSLCLPEMPISDRYLLINTPGKRTATYRFLLASKNDLVMHEAIIVPKHLQFRPVKLTFQKILHDINQHLLDVSSRVEYFEVIEQFFKRHAIQNREQVKVSSLGLLTGKYGASAHTCVCMVSNKRKTVAIEWIFFQDENQVQFS
uniref:Uncharacterized protein n=1 Tax=Romanomermis culicivorax TaxID=13658 RepID=A0A915KY40_ROMCU